MGGVEGHLADKFNDLNDYGIYLKYDGKDLFAVHDIVEKDYYNSRALWGFRDLYSNTEGKNPPPDPVTIPGNATYLGIVKDGSKLITKPGNSRDGLSRDYGKNLLAVFQGEFEENENGDYLCKGNSLRLAPAITASWSITDNSTGIVITKNGEIKATGVSLSAPTFKFYSPRNGNKDTSLKFKFDDGKMKIEMNPENNAAILHLDIPGTVCSVDSVTAEENGNLTFSGDMSMKTPVYDIVEINMNRLGAGNREDGTFGFIGFEASGKVDMSELLGMETAEVEGEINTFPGEESYGFEMEINVYDLLEAEAKLKLKRIQNGMLFPDTLYLFTAGETGIPLVPPVVVAELNGVGGGFSGFADTIKGDFFAIPPARLSLSAKATVLETVEGKATVTVGPGYYGATLEDVKILKADIIEEFSIYQELAGDIRTYKGTQYKGFKLGGGMSILLCIPKPEDKAWIKAGGEVNAFAFVGADKFASGADVYVLVDARGKVHGKVQIPDDWPIIGGKRLAGASLDFVMGGQTVFNNVSLNTSSFKNMMSSIGKTARSGIRNAAYYGGVAYTNDILGIKYRIYYLFRSGDGHKVGFEFGSVSDKFNPYPNNISAYNRAILIDEDTGERLGVMFMGDNMVLLASTALNDADTNPYAAGEEFSENLEEDQNNDEANEDEIDNSQDTDEDLLSEEGSATGQNNDTADDGETDDSQASDTNNDDNDNNDTSANEEEESSSDESPSANNSDDSIYGDENDDSQILDEGNTDNMNDVTVTEAVYEEPPSMGLMSVIKNDAEDKGVALYQEDDSETIYRVTIDGDKVDINNLIFCLVPKNGNTEEFFNALEVKKGETNVTLTPAVFNKNGDIINEANAVVNPYDVAIKLNEDGTYIISSEDIEFDISCIYVRPYASFENIAFVQSDKDYGSLTGKVKDLDVDTEYIIRTYLGDEKGGTDYILSQIDVTTDNIVETLELSGNVAPTGEYYLTITLLEKVIDDIDGDGKISEDEFVYLPLDTYEYEDPVYYTNTEQPGEPVDVSIESIGNEVMRARWKAPAVGDVDGYIISLYQEEDGEYVSTGMGYQLEASELAKDGDFYLLDMAVTVGDENNRLEAGKKYKVGIAAFKNQVEKVVIKEEGEPETTIDSIIKIVGNEKLSAEEMLPVATYPVLDYNPPLSGDGMKTLYVSGEKEITVYSDVEAKIVVTRMDKDIMDENRVVDETSGFDTALTFSTPDDFSGALNLKVTATDAEGDTTIDYIGIRMTDTAPTISLDNPVFKANYYNGKFTITGHTESGTVVSVTSDSNSVAELDAVEVIADENGKFNITGKLYPEVGVNESVSIPLIARNAAGLFTGTTALVSRGEKTNNNDNDRDDSDREDRGSSTNVNTSNISTGKQSNMPTVARMSVSGTAKDGVLSAKITEQMVKDAIKAAQDVAKQSGKDGEGIAVEFTATGSGTWNSMSVSMDAGVIDLLREAGVKYVKIGSSTFDITLDGEAIAEIDKQSTGAVTISARAQKKLSHEAKKLIGNRPVFDITVGYQKNGNTEYVTSFGNGTVTLGIPYKPERGENTNNLYGIYVDRSGRPHVLTNSRYENGRVIFERNSLSTYGVGYKTPAPLFSDIVNHWAKDNIDFVTSRDLIKGKTSITFAPNDFITRADFLMALGKLYGADVSVYNKSSFTDVKDTDPAMPYIEWAAQKQIVKGIGNNMFGPDLKISRQDMAVMMQNYTKATGYELPTSVSIITFSDDEKIAAYAKEAVKAIQQAGIMQGKGNNIFDPQGDATRGEAATILHRFVELVVDNVTHGWSQNDAGEWRYIGEDGKPVNGWFTDGNVKYYFTPNGVMVSGKWLQIEGKWYYFNDDGSLAVNTKVSGYEVDENGVRKAN